MYAIRPTQVAGLDALRLEGDGSLVEVVPSRGGLVTRFRVADDELLFLDEASVRDPSRNVRGGIPVLFPFAGRLPGDAWTDDDGRTFAAPQHGFARTLPWRVTAQGADEHGASVTLTLDDSAATRASFPRAYSLELELSLQSARLRITASITNRDTRPLPHAIGFHPYLRVPDAAKDRAGIETDATEAWDNRKGAPLAVGTPDFTAEELDWHLFDHSLPGTLLRRPPLRPIRFEWFEGFDTLVLWTLKGRDFVCVEPWAARAGTFPRGDGVRVVPPGETDRLSFAISV